MSTNTCEEMYNKRKLVHSIMRAVAETMGIDLQDLYIRVCMPLHRKYGHAFEEQGIAILNKAIEACTEEIERHKGKLTVKEAPRALLLRVALSSFFTLFTILSSSSDGSII